MWNAERRVFDEALEDAERGRTESAALRAAVAELDRLWAGARPSWIERLRPGPWAFFAGQVGVLALWSVSVVGGLWLAGTALVLIVLYEWTRHLRIRRYRLHRIGMCRACGYSMHGLADAIDPRLVGDRHVGPRVCPECGCHWPRLPPE